MGVVYSTRFLFLTGGGGTLAWTVPANKRAVIKAVTCKAQGPAGTGFTLTVLGVGIYNWVTPAQYATHVWDAMVVVYGGETMTVVGSGAGADNRITVSGHLLEAPVVRTFNGATGEGLGDPEESEQ